MKNFELLGTKTLPTVSLDRNNGTIVIEGISIPENIHSFYGPIINWVNEYSKMPRPSTRVDIRLIYYNTGTSKCLIEMFKVFERMHLSGNATVINWYYRESDSDIYEGGGDFAHILELPFNRVVEK